MTIAPLMTLWATANAPSRSCESSNTLNPRCPGRHSSLIRGKSGSFGASTDQHEGSDHFAVMDRAWVENRIQVALCEADVFPESSAEGAAAEHAEKERALIAGGIIADPARLN